MKMRQGTIIDAILIAAPSSTKNKAGEQDPEMHQTKKVNQWHFRMMVHIGVDKDTGLIHSVENTAAKVCDLSPAAELLLGEEEVVYGDVGYQGIDKRAEIEGKKMVFPTAMRPDKRRVLPDKPEGLENLVDSAKAHYTLAFPRPKAERGGATRLSTPAA